MEEWRSPKEHSGDLLRKIIPQSGFDQKGKDYSASILWSVCLNPKWDQSKQREYQAIESTVCITSMPRFDRDEQLEARKDILSDARKQCVSFSTFGDFAASIA